MSRCRAHRESEECIVCRSCTWALKQTQDTRQPKSKTKVKWPHKKDWLVPSKTFKSYLPRAWFPRGPSGRRGSGRRPSERVCRRGLKTRGSVWWVWYSVGEGVTSYSNQKQHHVKFVLGNFRTIFQSRVLWQQKAVIFHDGSWGQSLIIYTGSRLQ